MSVSATLLSLAENGAPGQFSVSLGAQPKVPVTLTLHCNRARYPWEQAVSISATTLGAATSERRKAHVPLGAK